MHHAVRSGNELRVVPEESTARKPRAGIEGYVVDRLLHREGRPCVAERPIDVARAPPMRRSGRFLAPILLRRLWREYLPARGDGQCSTGCCCRALAVP